MADQTDRELLELAAKAAGLKDAVWDDYYKAISHTADNGIDDCPWNPLTLDSEAFILAVKLRIDVTFNATDVCAFPADGRVGSGEFCHVDDPYAATRRAIVRAAANIGEAMP